MKRVNKVLKSLFCTLFFSATLSSMVYGDEPVWKSEQNLFQISYTSDLSPIAINQIHGWTLHIETIEGQALEGAQVSFTGGMPAHNHGMPTDPQVTAELGNGNYLLEGVRFHMMGYWELEVTIVTETLTDTITIPLEL